MQRLVKKILFAAIGMSLFFSLQPQAGISVAVNVPLPVPVEVVAPPVGYETCYVAPSGYYNGFFVHAHRVCEYTDSPYGGAWVSGYWQCGYYHNGVCGGNWVWAPSHWVQPGIAEYGVVWHGPGHYYHGHGGPHYGRGYGPDYGPGPGREFGPGGPHYRGGPHGGYYGRG